MSTANAPHLIQYVIYDKPSDFPDHYVVRAWEIRAPEPVAIDEVSLHHTLEQARDSLPEGLIRWPRYPDDDPAIVEVWF